MRKCFAIVSVGLRQMLADPMYLVFTLGLPLMMTWAMSFLPKEAGIYEMASLGVLVMFVALNLITSAGSILEERQNGTWQRILTSATSYWAIMAGYFIRLFLVAATQAAILLLSGKFLFGAPWNHGYLELVVVLAIYIFAMTGLGLFLAGLLKTQGQVQAVAMAIVMIGTMLGDVFFPIENPSGVIKIIAAISPQSWAAHALRDILTLGVSLSSLVVPLLWMTGLGMLLIIAGVLRIKIEA
ncbi:MAG: ABC transporter permease [Firmicutes bacterium]|nr:ABC transporter permease [Bacillota bacterium]